MMIFHMSHGAKKQTEMTICTPDTSPAHQYVVTVSGAKAE